MSLVRMHGYQIREYAFKNTLASGEKINIESKYSYSVKYSNTDRALGELTATVCDKDDPEKFNIKVVAQGIFSYTPGAERARIHVETFTALVPTLRSFIAMVTAASGIPALMIPDIDIETREIYSFEKPKPGNGV